MMHGPIRIRFSLNNLPPSPGKCTIYAPQCHFCIQLGCFPVFMVKNRSTNQSDDGAGTVGCMSLGHLQMSRIRASVLCGGWRGNRGMEGM